MKCGQGIQHRNVICRDSSGSPSGSCGVTWKPVSRQPCTGAKKNFANTAKSSDAGRSSPASGRANSVETPGISGSEG